MSNCDTTRAIPKATEYRASQRSTRQPYRPPLPIKSTRRYRAFPIIVGGVLTFVFSASATHLYTSISKAPSSDPSLPAQDSDVSDRYNITARTFDQDVGSYEQFSFINYKRKTLARKAQGHVLEVSAGTGRNADFYNLKRCKSLTFVDLSGPMMQVAREKFQKSHPEYSKAVTPRTPVAFLTQSALDPLPEDVTKEVNREGGYDTILQTMGLCSTPQPAKLLMHLGTLAHPERGKILLLEHGRSHYKWLNDILDKIAAERAKKKGCWWNRDIGRIVEESGLVVEKVRRKHFGTLWIVEARPKASVDGAAGKGRAQDVLDEGAASFFLGRLKGILGSSQEPGEQKAEEKRSEKD